MALLIFFALSILFYNLYMQEKIEATIEQQLELIRNNQFTEAYYALTSNEFQTATSLKDFKDFLKSFPILFAYDFFEIHSLEEKLALGIFKNSNGDVLNLQYKLQKYEGKWKIAGIEVVN